MAQRKIELSLEVAFVRRLAARAADVGMAVNDVARQELAGWLGDWGQRYATHTVKAGETLRAIAYQYYGNKAKMAVIAAFNDIENPNLLRVGQVLYIPEVEPTPEQPLQPLPKGESPYIFGLHDRGGEYYMAWANRKGWVLCTEELGANRNDWGTRSYADLADNGYGVIVRLNHGYGQQGTLPNSQYYADFAMRCGNFVEKSNGCHIWIIGNETNMAWERPGGPEHGEWITPTKYVAAFRACRKEIRRRPSHSDDQVVMAAVAPWNVQTPYPENPSGDWIIYFQHVLRLLGTDVDGIALHTYARDADPANIVSELCMDPPFNHRRKMFRTYMDFMQAIPDEQRHLPVYITETNQNQPWEDSNRGWIQEAYAEINRWNSNPANQKIRCLLLYRWELCDSWGMQGKNGLLNDLRAALQRDCRWHS